MDGFGSLDLDAQSTGTSKSQKTPKLVYCGDGVLEEYSDDEQTSGDQTDARNPVEQKDAVDTKKLSWMPWFKYYALAYATKTLSVCDFMGEKLAWWLGITQPKYLYEIEEYNRLKQKYEASDEDDDAYDLEKNSNNTIKTTQLEMRVINNKQATQVMQFTDENIFQSH